MSGQYPVNDDDVEDVLEDDEELADDDSVEDEDADVSYSSGGKQEGYEDFSVAARERMREELARQVEDFLSRGGHINEIPSTMSFTRPKKPVSDYGDRMM
ncbi:hypothetical protein [Marinimicrobium sp. ARAG 43.8]|uniref:hypothetical protein n=1 Tax=Marinimicrobium sp. ARAG 43.8 TaxID=3418719 RepID=UPI003CF576DE